MEHVRSNTATNCNLINAMRGIESYTGERPEDCADLHRKTSFILSMQRPDIFAVMEGQARLTEEQDEEAVPLLTPGLLYAPGGTLLQHQSAYDRANQDLYAILYLMTDKAAALLVAIHAFDERGTRVDGRGVMQELEKKSTSGSRTKLSVLCRQMYQRHQSMEPDEDADNYIYHEGYTHPQTARRDQRTCRRSPFHRYHRPRAPGEVSRHQGYDLQDPDFDLTKIQATMRHLYLDGLSRNETGRIAYRGTAMTAASEPYLRCYLPHITAVRTATIKAVVPCLTRCTEEARSLVLDTTRRRSEEELGKSGAQYTRQPHTLTPNATRKGLRAQRQQRVARTRLLCWVLQ